MSRLLVKNLPSGIKESRLRTVFQEHGTVTDCSLKYTAEGVFRKFAFIGFKTDKEAAAALKALNQSFIDTTKIQVVYANDLTSLHQPKSKSKESKKKKKTETSDAEEIKAKTSDNIKKESSKKKPEQVSDADFLKSKMAQSLFDDSSSSDDDDDDDDDKSRDIKPKNNDVDDDKDDGELDSDVKNLSVNEKAGNFKQDQNQKVHKIILRGAPPNIKKSQIEDFFRPIQLAEVSIPRKMRSKKGSSGVISVTLKNSSDGDAAMRRNKNYIGSKKVFLTLMKENMGSGSKTGNQAQPYRPEEDASQSASKISETSRIFIRNLAYCCTEADLQELFSKYGPDIDVSLPIDKLTRKIKGFAIISFPTSENAVRAFTELDGTIFQGRMLHLLPGESKKNDLEITEDMPYSKKKEILKKLTAGSSHNWNALFVGANSVADVMAEKYQTTKSDILLKSGKQSVGVRVALGETQIVSEIRQFLIDNSVALDSFSQAAGERSKTVILVKHLPAGATEEEIRGVFERFGIIARLVLPPNGLTAIIEFYEPMEAKAAFTTLAYSKFKHVPLYLEWAPMNVFTKPAEAKELKISNKKENADEATDEKPKNTEILDIKSENTEENDDDVNKEDDDDSIAEPGSTLFVKNLNFSTTEESLRKKFEKYGKIREVSIARKKDNSGKGVLLSMGYGFVGYRSATSAQEALKHLQNSDLDDHHIELKVSNRVTLKPGGGKKLQELKGRHSTKILIRNIPFEAKLDELRQLFSVFGELKSIRVPKKLRGTHRGFGFVDFLTKGDAKRAFDALCHSTHLYGRRLVLEWAEEELAGDEAVDTLRRKTASKFSEDEPKLKRKKTAMLEKLKP